MLKSIYFSKPFGVMFVLRWNLPSPCIIKCESFLFSLWNGTKNFWFNLTLILQSLCSEPLLFLVIWQWSLTLTSPLK